MAVVADRNPWMAVQRVNDPNQDWASFMPDLTGMGDPNADRLGNSDVHQQDGQNVLHLDGHVRFYTSAVNKETDDNVYTLAADSFPLGKAKGVVPRVWL